MRMEVAEHILLESDLREMPDPRAPRKVHARAAFCSRLRRRRVQLEIIDYYYLAVRLRSRSANLEYVLDLRFVDAPRLSRQVAWPWIVAAFLLTSLAYGIMQLHPGALPWWQRHGLAVYTAVGVAWVATALVAIYRTTTTLSLFSTDGAAKLLEYTAGLGSLRGVRRFMAKVAAHVRLAAGARRSTRPEHLRDEMREHGRLKELGVLSEPEYESAKVRILRKHSPAARSPRARAMAKA